MTAVPDRYLLSFFPMVKDGQRSCDICAEPIEKGEKYAVVTVPKDKSELFRALTDTAPDLAPTASVDSLGNLRLDVCSTCRLSMTSPGVETIQ
jgi:hypothetical protein